MSWPEPIKNRDNKSPIHQSVSIKSKYVNTLRSPIQHSKTHTPLIVSVRSIGITTELQQAKDDLLRYLSELPQKDINNIGIVVFDWMSEKRGECIRDSLPESYWDEKGREQSKKDYIKYIKKPNRDALLFNPIWGENERLEQSTVYHEIGHTLFHKFRPGNTPEVIFWNQQANKNGWDAMTDPIIKKYPTHKGGLGRGSLVMEYLADHYAAYHLGKTISQEEKEWFDNYYKM